MKPVNNFIIKTDPMILFALILLLIKSLTTMVSKPKPDIIWNNVKYEVTNDI